MTDTLDVLRILAKDGGRLTSTDREMLTRAADELEYATKELIAMQAHVIEIQQQRIALGETVARMRAEAERKLQPFGPYDPSKWGSIKLGVLR